MTYQRITIGIFFFLFSSVISYAQFTVTSADYRSGINQSKSVAQFICEPCDEVIPLIETRGENSIWDFTHIDFDFVMEGEYGIRDGIKSPIDSDQVITHTKFWSLSVADESEGFELDMTDYFFLTIEGSKVYRIAEKEVAKEIFEDEIAGEYFSTTRYESPLIALKFPLAFGDRWESESMAYYKDDEMDEESETKIFWEVNVDGWGILQTAHGNLEVLRIHSLKYRTSRMVPSREIYYFVDKNGIEQAKIEYHVGVYILTLNEFK